MSNQETKTSTGRYAPSVNYNQQAPQAIDQRLQSKVDVKSPDWLNIGMKTLSDVTEIYGKAQAVDAEKAFNAAKNDLARQANMIAEEQRQLGMPASAAASRYRMLADSALGAGVLTEKDIADVIGRYDGGILNIDQSRQQKIMEDDQKYWAQQSQEIADNNPSIARMQPSDRTKLLMGMRTLTDDVNKYRNWMGNLPDGEEKNAAKAYFNQLMGSNIHANMTIQLGNMFAQAKVVTEEDWAMLRHQAVQACMTNGMDRGTAGILVDEVAKSYSVTGDLTDIKRYFKDNANYLESANKLIMANANNRVLSMPGMAYLKAFPEELQAQLINENFSTYEQLIRPFTAKPNKDGTLEGLDRISIQMAAPLAQAVNNMNSSGMYNDYVRGKASIIALNTINKANTITPTSSVEEAKVVALNSDGTRQYINFNLARKQIENLKKSEDPEEVAVGEIFDDTLAETEAQEWLAKNIPVADKIVKTLTNFNGGDRAAYQANNSLQRSTNAASLRYNDDGELFISDADRNWLANTAYNFDQLPLVGGEYKEELATINNKLSSETPEMRKLILARAGYKQAEAGELPIAESMLPAEANAVKGIVEHIANKKQATSVDKAEVDILPLSEDTYASSIEANKELWEPVTSSATIRNSETMADAHLSVWDTVEESSAADIKASKNLGEYDTELGAVRENMYHQWKQSLPKQLQSEEDYDLRGYYKETGGETTDGHLPDKYKKPNHPTFSKDSKYYKEGMWAGEWTKEGNFKIPLTTPKKKLQELIKYWESGAEPYAGLIVDNPKAEEELAKAVSTKKKYLQQLEDPYESEDVKRMIRSKGLKEAEEAIEKAKSKIYVYIRRNI